MTDVKAHEYEAVRHILTSTALEARTAPYIEAGDYDWAGLLSEAETMSGGEQALVRIAHDLWNAGPLAGVWEIPKRLDSGNFTPDQVEWVARSLEEWTQSVTLTPPPGTGANFFIDLSGTGGLQRQDRPQANRRPIARRRTDVRSGMR